jgi:hypothetical protein
MSAKNGGELRLSSGTGGNCEILFTGGPGHATIPAVPREQSINAEAGQGKALLAALKTVLKRGDEAGVHLGYPGEGGERPFRAWLVSDLLAGVLRWPSAKIVVGERFDILLQDAEGFPVSTIETKRPYHQASEKERRDFEGRLSGFGTLRTAYFTNGPEWERLDIFSPTGTLQIRERFVFNLRTATAEEAEAFFAPLAADRHFASAPRTNRHSVSASNPHILKGLAADLQQTIGDIAYFLHSLLSGFREGKCGAQTRGIALSLFDLWCEKSLVVSPRQASERLMARFRREAAARREIEQWLAEFGLTSSQSASAVDALATLPEAERLDPGAVANALWPAYANAARNFCAQTAHVFLARALLYRIGEDQGVFPRHLSGHEMQRALTPPPPTVVEAPKPATDLLSRVRQSMQEFLPTIYKLGEFDWWLVLTEKRAVLDPNERAWIRSKDEEFERVAQRVLRTLDGYFFGRVDVDVWRNVYQHYLPADERQRLGGFYTAEDLVSLVLDLAEFVPECQGLCQLSSLDMASGSGAFVASTLARLLQHLELDLPCHAHLHKRGLPDWKRAEGVLQTASHCLHAVDIHPFAAFLTTLNVLFLLMPFYVKARTKNPDFSLDLQIFSADSLEKHDADLVAPGLFTKLNSRVQLTEDSFRRFQQMLRKRFDRVFGNPPWGGVLKGTLAPVYDSGRKGRLKHEYPAAAQGKYDIYGLFMERALQVLQPGGRFGLVTQGTFIDKRWAAGLRELLAHKSRLRYVVDLNPFGQLLFHAMNTPCITVADAVRDANPTDECIAVLSRAPEDFKGLSEDEKRTRVMETVRKAVLELPCGRKSHSVGFAQVCRVPLQRLRETAAYRWNLSVGATVETARQDRLTAADLLETRQGVTPGGCLELFLMTQMEAKALELEDALVRRAVKSKQMDRWRVHWGGLVLLYPYDVVGDELTPAFELERERIKDDQLREAIRRLGVEDALDFERQLDDHETEITRRKGVNRATVPQLLKHRIGLGLVNYPKVAQHLVHNYEQLEGRVFEKKRFVDLGKRWYEYHRPREPKLMFSRQRILSPTLVKTVRFSLDAAGYLSDHACLYIQPTPQTRSQYVQLRKQLSAALRHGEASSEDVLKYCLAFLNSAYAQQRLVTGHRPTPKGFYAVTKQYLEEIPIPPPAKTKAKQIVDLVTKLTTAREQGLIDELEKGLAKLVDAVLKP